MKGQGLPTSTIILVIMAIAILVMVMIFVVLPILNTATAPKPPSTTMSSFIFNCATYCGQPTSANNVPANTYFCTKTVDYNGTVYHCYDSYAGKTIATCSYISQNGTSWSNVDSITCKS